MIDIYIFLAFFGIGRIDFGGEGEVFVCKKPQKKKKEEEKKRGKRMETKMILPTLLFVRGQDWCSYSVW